MKYRLNRKSLERLKALVRAGQFVPGTLAAPQPGNPINWAEYSQSFLGIEQGKPDSDAANGDTNTVPHADWYAYPFGDGRQVGLETLKTIVKQAKAAGEMDVATAAQDAIDQANLKIADDKATQAKSKACDVNIRFAAPVEFKAAAGGTGKKIPTFTADAYTGAAMTLEGFGHPVVIDYDGMDFTAHRRPVLRDHDPKRPIGHTNSLGVVGGVLKAAGEISVVSPDAQEVIDAGKNNFPWQISVGAKVLQSQFIPEGETAQANGKTWPGPLIVARQTSLREISFLTLGADDDTSARIAAQAAKGAGMPALKKKFAAWAKGRNITLADMEDDAMSKAAKDLYKAQMKCEADDASDEDAGPEDLDDKKKDKEKDSKSGANDVTLRANAANSLANLTDETTKTIRAAALAENKRQAALNAVFGEYEGKIDAAKFVEIKAKAINGDYDQTKTELEFIRAARPNAPMINTGAGSQLSGNILAAAACMANGMTQAVATKGLDERSGNLAASGRLRSASLHTVIAMIAPTLGLHAQAGGIDRDFLNEFLPADRAKHRQELKAARVSGLDLMASSGAGFATMSLTGILENILNKSLLEQYGLQTSVVSDIAFERDTTDFKPYKVYRLTAAGDLQPVGPGGEIKTMSLQDESYSNQVSTKAALVPIKREDIMNDDMGAITQTSQIAGRKGALNREKAVFTSFLSGLTTVAPGPSIGKTANTFNFWSTGAKNLLSGGSSALSISSMTTAAQKFVQQTDANGDPIMIAPDRVLCCPEVFDTAKALFGGSSVVVGALGSTSSKSLDANINVHAGAYRPIRSPFLGGASPVTGASATQWALLCNPAGGTATVQVGYLRGQRTPIIRQVDVDATMLGLAYQIIFDFGVSLLDFRCGVYSAGA